MCQKVKAHEWAKRILDQIYISKKGFILTLTYGNTEDQDFGEGSLSKRDVQLFHKRLRKYLSPLKIKHVLTGEYSPVGRPHYHAIYLGAGLSDIEAVKCKWGKYYDSKVIRRLWGKGHITVDDVSKRGIYYVTGYLLKSQYHTKEEYEKGKYEKPFLIASRELGLEYMKQFWKESIDDAPHVPRYYNKKAKEIDDKYNHMYMFKQMKYRGKLEKIRKERKLETLVDAQNWLNANIQQQIKEAEQRQIRALQRQGVMK